MILNYRVELCRQCYFKRVQRCTLSDQYIQNLSYEPTRAGGECLHHKAIPWLPRF